MYLQVDSAPIEVGIDAGPAEKHSLFPKNNKQLQNARDGKDGRTFNGSAPPDLVRGPT